MKIYKKLMEVQHDLKAPKGQTNKFGNYKYRSCEDILEALKPFLYQQGMSIFMSDEVIEVNNRNYVKSTVTLVDIETGETISNTGLAREEEIKKGMDGSQITGASSSYARKYALNGMFAIDDTKDSDYTNTHGKEEVKTSPKPAGTTPKERAIKMIIEKTKDNAELLDTAMSSVGISALREATEEQLKQIFKQI